MSTKNATFLRQVRQEQHGQIALIILLLMAVVLTIGLSLASRAVMDVSLSRQEEQGSMTFQAAESGIENTLNHDLSGYLGTHDLSQIGGAYVVATVSAQNIIQTRVEEGGSIQVNVAGANNGETLWVNWGKGESCPGVAAVLVRAYNLTGGVYTARNYAYSACSVTNGYPLSPNQAAHDPGFLTQFQVPLFAGDQVVSVHPLYNSTTFYVRKNSGAALPTQYYTVRSEAKNLQGNEVRAVAVTKTVAGHPGLLDYTLYSGNALNQ